MAQDTFNDGDALSVVRTTINANANDAEGRLANLEFSITHVVFVSKGGNDSNSGLSVAGAKLTIGAAITVAAAMTPASDNQITVQVIDSAEYTEDFTLPEWVHLRAALSTINGKVDIQNNCILKARRLENTTGTGLYCVRKNDSGGLAKVQADIMIVGTGNEGIRANGGQIGLIIDTIVVDGGEGLLAKSGSRLAFTVQFMSLSNSADGITTKTVGGAANSFYGNILRVEDDGTCCLIKTKVDGDNLQIQGGSFIVNELYNLGINSTLNIFVNESVGAKVADPSAQVNLVNVSGDSNLEGDLNVEGVLTGPTITEIQKPGLTVIPIFTAADLPAAVAGVITLDTANVRYQLYDLIDLGTDRIDATASTVQIQGKTPSSGFLYTGTGVLISTTATLQLFNINLIGMSASKILDAVDSDTGTVLCRSLGFVGGTSTELACIDSYGNALFELCGFVSGSTGICLANTVKNFTVTFCQFQKDVLGVCIDYGTALCTATAVHTCVAELSATSTFMSVAANNGNIATDGGGTITSNKIDSSEVGSVATTGLSPLDLSWTVGGNTKNITSSDRLNPTGWAFYADGDTVTQTVPSGAGSAIVFSVDGLGANTNSDFEPRVIRGVGELWDTSTNEMVPITEGDSFNTRIAFTMTAKSGNPTILTVVFDIGGAAGITIPVYVTSIATPNSFPRTITLTAPIFALGTFLANNGRVFMYTDSGSIDVEARSVLIQRTSSGAS